jgi:hypothetical protein
MAFAALAAAETWTGTVVVLGDGKFVKFNEGGNAKALKALKATAKENDLKAKVSGTLKDDVIQVESIEIE